MKRLGAHYISLAIILGVAACTATPTPAEEGEGLVWEQLTDYQTPDTCFNKGVSAAYCGIVNEHLLLAGGCNFPHVPAAESGEKLYYDYIWTAPLNQGTSPEWTLAGRLPQPAAYGITLPYNGGLICIGGMTSGGQTLRDVFFLNLKDDEIQVDPLPALPVAIDNAYGSMADQKVYVVGGNADGKPSNTVYTLDLADEQASWVGQRFGIFWMSVRKVLVQELAW